MMRKSVWLLSAGLFAISMSAYAQDTTSDPQQPEGATAEAGAVDQATNAGSERHIDAGRNADATGDAARAGEFGDGMKRRQKMSGECGVGSAE